MATYDGLTSSSSLPPPEPRGQGREGGEGFGCWVVVGRVSLQASGHILYWMPRKRHMAKIMAKSCRESRCRLVRLGPHPSTGRPPCGTRAGRARYSQHTPAVGTRGAPWRQALLTSRGAPSRGVVTARKGLWKPRDMASNPAPSLPLVTVGQTLPFSGPVMPLELTMCQAQIEALS